MTTIQNSLRGVIYPVYSRITGKVGGMRVRNDLTDVWQGTNSGGHTPFIGSAVPLRPFCTGCIFIAIVVGALVYLWWEKGARK